MWADLNWKLVEEKCFDAVPYSKEMGANDYLWLRVQKEASDSRKYITVDFVHYK